MNLVIRSIKPLCFLYFIAEFVQKEQKTKRYKKRGTYHDSAQSSSKEFLYSNFLSVFHYFIPLKNGADIIQRHHTDYLHEK